MNFKSVLTAGAVAFAVFAAAPQAFAAKPEIYTTRFSDDAVKGYDVVAYFDEGMPVKGSDEYTYEYKGATWKFSSAENRDKFIADPEAYAPQYGGYCAYAVSQGKTAKAEPENWTIVDGKLYLNYNDSIQKKWEKDKEGYIEKADDNWPDVIE